jgi:hypothetical protein
MAGKRVFISYSRKDSEFLEQFTTHLRPWQDRGLLDIWIDERVQPGEDWHQEIQQMIASAGVAVLLISPDFLASEYIRDHELPHLLNARKEEKLEIACLFLRSSLVDDDGCVFDNGQGKPTKLTRYKGLNSPKQPVAMYHGNDRDRLYVQAASQLRQLAQRFGIEPAPRAKRSGTSDHEVTIALQLRRDGKLYGAYSSPNNPCFLNETLPGWPSAQAAIREWLDSGALTSEATELGTVLFQLLFGVPGSDFYKRVFRGLFDDPQTLPPDRYRVRVRLQTTEPLLMQSPWRQTSYRNKPLAESDWTFELLPVTAESATPDYPGVRLSTPCEIVIIAPTRQARQLRSDAHRTGLEHLFQTLWTEYPWPPSFVSSRRELVDKLSEYKPHIVYYYGSAETVDQKLVLLLDEPQGGSEQMTLDELAGLWNDAAPKVLFLNLVGKTARQGMHSVAKLLPAVKFVAVQITSQEDTLEAREAGIRWLEALLKGSDPLPALHDYGLSDVAAWGAYQDWKTRTDINPPPAALVELLLDRLQQRERVNTRVIDLVQHDDRRLQVFLVYGDHGNQAEQFAIQLREHLRHYARQVICTRPFPLSLPNFSEPFGKEDVRLEMRQRLGLRQHQTIIEGIAKLAPVHSKGESAVLMLNWRYSSLPADFSLLADQLKAWLAFCREELAACCPEELRLLSYLGLELGKERHQELRNLLDTVKRQSNQGDDWTYDIEVLSPLDDVSEEDLERYLSDRKHCNCPDSIRRKLPRLIFGKTKGKFDATVKLLQQGASGHWQDLYDNLAAK